MKLKNKGWKIKDPIEKDIDDYSLEELILKQVKTNISKMKADMLKDILKTSDNIMFKP